ncbi:ketopantoate reductase family protein [Enemella sp. A6]|uniref:ketopantoate reductase family protein n=1 Tax=Enemella sp. A6 TaxID=3440152 RepID=UPI003EB99089
MSSAEIRTVAVVGAGAMGAMYAAHFVAGGLQTWLVATGERAERLRSGMTVNGEPLTAEVVDPEEASGRVADLVLVAVKHQQLAEAVELVAPVVSTETTFLSVLNGLDSEETIAARFGREAVLPCIALAMDAERSASAVSFRQAGRLTFGPTEALGAAERVAPVCAALDRAGLAYRVPEDMRHELWWKFMVNVGMNQASAVLRAPYGAFKAEGHPRSLMMALIDEVLAVSAAEGVHLDESDVATWSEVLAGQPDQGVTSMHQDVMAGRPTEVEIFAGRVIELGAKHGIPTPYNQAMRWILP